MTQDDLQTVQAAFYEALSTTRGLAEGDGYSLDVGGACPVQGWGEVDRHPCYFRARGECWQFEVYAMGVDPRDDAADPIWQHEADDEVSDPGGQFCASWMTIGASRECIAAAVALWRARK